MNLQNKFIIGFAQSNPKYGVNKKNNFESVFKELPRHGFKYFDTAENYEFGDKFIKRLPKKKSKIITKISFNLNTNDNFRKSVKKKIYNILEKNNLKKLYGLLIHDPLLPLNKLKWPIIFSELKKLKKLEIIDKIGISVYNKYELNEILKVFTPEIVQFPLNVFNQSFNDRQYLQSLKGKGIELHARSIFLQGILLKDKVKDKNFRIWHEKFKEWKIFTKKNKLNKLNACLSFILKNKLVDKIVIGLANKEQLNNFINEVKKIKKKNNTDYNFNKLKSDDVFLNDPRYWANEKNISPPYILKKVLVTGSSGLVGSYLMQNIKSKDIKILSFKRKINQDFSNKIFCEKYLSKHNFYAIINLSAITNVDKCEKNKKLAKKINYLIVKNICNSIKKLNLETHLIQLSTDQFYNKFSINFEKQKNFKNYYTKTKLMSENECKKISSTILRTNFVGKSRNKNRVSFSDWIYKTLKEKKNIYLADDILFNPVSLKTLTSIIKLILKKKIRGLFNIGSKKGYSKYEFGIKFSKKLFLDVKKINRVKSNDIKFFAKRNDDMRMKVNKFENYYDYKFNTLDFELEEISSEYKKLN